MTVNVFDRQGDAPVPPADVRLRPAGGEPARTAAAQGHSRGEGHDHDHDHADDHRHSHGHGQGHGHEHGQSLGEASFGGPLGTGQPLPALGLGGGETRTVRIAPSLLRFGLGQRLAIAAVTIAALWGATFAVIG